MSNLMIKYRTTLRRVLENEAVTLQMTTPDYDTLMSLCNAMDNSATLLQHLQEENEMSNEKVGTKHLTQRPREPEGSRGVELDRHSQPWEVMNLLWEGHKNLTELDNCYSHTPQGEPEDSIAHEEVECMIRSLMPEKDIEYNLRFTVRAKHADAVGALEVRDALHALLTEAGNGYLMRQVTRVEPDGEFPSLNRE